MPDLPPAAVQAATEAVRRELLSRDYAATDPDEALARAALEAAAPILAEAVAKKITAHADRQFPPADPAKRPGQADRWRTWHRHFGIAARIAAGAFTTEDERKRAAAGALARGEFIACREPGDADA
jgi:hypothetical protein